MERLLPHLYDFYRRHAFFWRDRQILKHVGVSVLLLLVSIVITYVTRIYADNYTGYIVPDILLDRLPVVDVGILFFQGALLFFLFVTLLLLYQPKFIPFTLEASAVFFFVRSIFTVMTHLSPPTTLYYNYIEHEHHMAQTLFTISSGGDLFFSGHTGFPFLLALIFWKNRYLRTLFLVCSVFGAAIVLLGHLHYTIDVFSAFFIAFGVFSGSCHVFKKEYALLESANSLDQTDIAVS